MPTVQGDSIETSEFLECQRGCAPAAAAWWHAARHVSHGWCILQDHTNLGVMAWCPSGSVSGVCLMGMVSFRLLPSRVFQYLNDCLGECDSRKSGCRAERAAWLVHGWHASTGCMARIDACQGSMHGMACMHICRHCIHVLHRIHACIKCNVCIRACNAWRGRMDTWTDGCMHGWMHACMNAWVHGCMRARMHAWVDGWVDG